MVGVDKEERLGTPLMRSLMLRHPWLQVNLFTAFIAAGVVSLFEGTLNQLVILAVFLPVMAGQTGNTGCQALAVTLRGMGQPFGTNRLARGGALRDRVTQQGEAFLEAVLPEVGVRDQRPRVLPLREIAREARGQRGLAFARRGVVVARVKMEDRKSVV